MSISVIRNNDINLLKTFLECIPSIKEIKEEVLSNSIIIIDDNIIVGNISLELYGKKGLIRYFVFRKSINSNYLNSMIEELIKLAKELKLEEIICIADNNDVIELFRGLGFDVFNKNIYFDEEIYKAINNSNSSYLAYYVK